MILDLGRNNDVMWSPNEAALAVSASNKGLVKISSDKGNIEGSKVNYFYMIDNL